MAKFEKDAVRNALLKRAELDDMEADALPEVKKSSGKAIRKSVHPSMLVPNELNKYNMRRDEEYEELVKAIKKDGQLHPVTVKPENEDGKYVIISGHRRLAAALELGLDKITIEIRQNEYKKSEEIAFIGRGNIGSRQKYPYDNALQIKNYYAALDEEGTYSSSEKKQLVIENFGISSERTYYNYDNLSVLPEEILVMGQDGLLTRDQGLTLSKGYRKEETRRITENVFPDLVKISSLPGATDEEKIEQVKKRFKAYDTALQKKDTAVIEKQKAEKKLSAKVFVKKLDKLWSDDMILPTTQKDVDQTVEALDKTIERLNALRAQLKSN